MNLEKDEHVSCGTPDCCMSCETAVPVQLEFNFSKDTKSEVITISTLEKKSNIKIKSKLLSYVS